MEFRARVKACLIAMCVSLCGISSLSHSLIATKMAPSDSGVDCSWDCSLVHCVLVDLDSGRVGPGLIQFGTKF